MIRLLRRRAARVLARAFVLVDPDPPMKITTVSRVDVQYEVLASALADVVSGKIGGNLGLGLRPPEGPAARY